MIYMPVYVSNRNFFLKNGKFILKCLEKYDAGAKYFWICSY